MLERYLYLHICTIGTFDQIITRLMDKVVSSGLLNDIDQVRYVVLGEHSKRACDCMQRYAKTKCIHTDSSTQAYERATLHCLRADCEAMTRPAHILYLHCKGVTKIGDMRASVDRWVDAMLDGLATYRHLCWRALDEGHDAVGSMALTGCRGMRREALPVHFSGNFWWASSSHLAGLPLVGPGYLDPEMWVLGSRPTTRYVTIDNLASGGHPFNAYASFPPLSVYRTHIVFRGLLRKQVDHATIQRMEMGLGVAWTSCIVPGPGLGVSFSLPSLGVDSDPVAGSVKMVRIQMTSGDFLYFLENEVVDLV